MYQKKCVHQAVMRLGKYVPQGLPTHVETVVLLGNQKTKPDSHIKLSVDMDEFNRVKNGEK